MKVLDLILWNRSMDDLLKLIVNREQRQDKPQPPLSTPSFYEGRRAPRLKTWLYHFFMTIGVVCMALIFGGMLGILFKRLIQVIP